MTKFFSFSFWFASDPGKLTPIFAKTLLVSVSLFFVAFLLFYFFSKAKIGPQKKLLSSLAGFCFTNFLVGVLLYFFTDQSVPTLSARIWFLIWLLEMAIWLSLIFKSFKKRLEKYKKNKEKGDFKKYLP